MGRLVLFHDSPAEYRWQRRSGCVYLLRSGGSADGAFAPASSFVQIPPGTVQAFRLDGTAIPEPQTAYSLAAGILAMVLLKTMVPKGRTLR